MLYLLHSQKQVRILSVRYFSKEKIKTGIKLESFLQNNHVGPTCRLWELVKGNVLQMMTMKMLVLKFNLNLIHQLVNDWCLWSLPKKENYEMHYKGSVSLLSSKVAQVKKMVRAKYMRMKRLICKTKSFSFQLIINRGLRNKSRSL